MSFFIDGDRDAINESDWVMMTVMAAFAFILPMGIFLAGQTLQVFQEVPSTEVQEK